MWHLQAFTHSVEATRIRKLLLEYDHTLIHLSALQMGQALRNILEISFLFSKLKTLTFIRRARTGLATIIHETRLQHDLVHCNT